MKYLFLLILCSCITVVAQSINIQRAAATARPGGEASVPELRDFPNEGKGLECKCVFSTSIDSKRAYWDIPFLLDLSQTAALKLTIKCTNIENAGQYSAYIKAGNTWYSADFEANSPNTWQEIIIPKTSFTTNDTGDSSWKNCSVLRLAIWKGAPGRASISITKAEFLRPNSSIALIRPYGTLKQHKLAMKMSSNLNSTLSLHGIYPAVIDENDITYSTLHLYKMLLVPSTDALNNEQTMALISCMRNGCKAGFFHSLSPRIAAQLGTPQGKFTTLNAKDSSLAWIMPNNQLLPNARATKHIAQSFIAVDTLPPKAQVLAYWADSHNNILNKPAIIETNAGFWMTHTYLNQDPTNGGTILLGTLARFMPEIKRTAANTVLNFSYNWFMHQAPHTKNTLNAQFAQAQNAFNAQQYEKCISICNTLQQNSYTTQAQTTKRKGEIRGIWCQKINGLPGYNWQETAANLARQDVNAVFILAASPFATAYPSRIIAGNNQNPLHECINACHKQGISVHAWINCLDLSDAPENIINSYRNARQLQINEHGNTITWLCPNNPDNRKFISRLITEAVYKNEVDGIHFDRIRFPARESCYCQHCKKAFENYAKVNIKNWPADIRSSQLQPQWNAFRIACIDALLAELLNSARTAKKNIIPSAAVYSDANLAKYNVGQDWTKWLNSKWLSFASPMNYRKSVQQFQSDLTRQTQLVDKARIVPGIGRSPCRLTDAEISQQIYCVRSLNLPGYIIFDL